eukprot:9152809-Pyramimonas_sp.AAC.1
MHWRFGATRSPARVPAGHRRCDAVFRPDLAGDPIFSSLVVPPVSKPSLPKDRLSTSRIEDRRQ